MNKINFILAAAVTVVFALTVFITLRDRNTNSIAGKKVAATIFPLCDMVRNVGGNKIDIVCILPPGASPHTFDPSPQEIKAVTGSSALFSIGNGLDDWSQDFAKSADIKTIVIVDKNINLMDSTHEHDENSEEKEEHESPGGGKDPHYWLSVTNAILMSEQIKDQLSGLFPENATDFESNYKAYKLVLNDLQEEIDLELKKLPDINIATFHNAWGYFGRDHGVNIIATFEEYPGEEPSVSYLKEFQNKITDSGIKVIFSEPQFSTKPLEPIAQDLGVKISILDPIGGVEGRNSYESLMRYNVSSIEKALQ